MKRAGSSMAPDRAWHRAFTLAERAARPLHRAPTGPLESASHIALGKKRLSKWKSQYPFDVAAIFKQRLEQAGLTEPQLLEMLSEPPEAPTIALGEPPDWAVELLGALAESPNPGLSLGVHQRPVEPQARFLELVRPLIGSAIRRLRECCRSTPSPEGIVALDLDIERMLVGLIPDSLLPVLLRTMALELNVGRLEGRLCGKSAAERFESFVARIQQPQVRLELLREYPVLGRLIVSALEDWVSSSIEFLRRWQVDWPAIRATFSPGEDPGPPVGIEGSAGDRHRGGRTVWIIQCQSGFRIVYKPRSLAVDQHFQETLGWLNARGISSPFRQLKILNRGAYGWEEFISPETCSSQDQVVRFYERSGGYLALLRALAAADFHHENVIAVGEQPMLIDLETLFHSSALEPEPKEAADVAGDSFRESVLGPGLLPVPIWSGRQRDVFDMSGLGADAGKWLPMRLPDWKDLGSDRMQFARQPAMVESSDHQPRLNGSLAKPLDYLDAIERGFVQVYQVLEQHRRELVAPGGLLERFARDEVRVVLRDTSRYAELLQEASHPDVLRDALDRDRLFDRLWDEVKDRPRLAQVIPAEIEDLWRGDVPLFTSRPDSRDLWASAERHFKNALFESGMECVKQRLGRLGPKDLQRQLWFLRSSLATLASAKRPPNRHRQVFTARARAGVSRRHLLAASCAIGDRLAERAYHNGDEVTWIGLSMQHEEKWVLVPLGLDLYDGVPGVGLFLAYLGAITGRQRYTDLAMAALNTVRRKLRPARRKQGWNEIGGFLGWGGILYTFAHLGSLWGDKELLREANNMCEALPDRIAKDTNLDIIGGAAGCIAALLCLHSCSPSHRLLEIAVQCGDHLLAHALQMPRGLGWNPQPANPGPLTGFSHGAAGISWALLELAAKTCEDRFRTAASEGIAYERSLFSVKACNWPDLRVGEAPGVDSARDPAFVVAWCHGAPGIGLARLQCRRHLKDPLLDTEIEAAVKTTLANGFGANHSLCHGDLGNLELLRGAADSFPASPWAATADRVTTGILSDIKQGGWRCGNPLTVESPGLLTGIAGIGYGLLRCAEPHSVPSVLMLACPSPVRQGCVAAAMGNLPPIRDVRHTSRLPD